MVDDQEELSSTAAAYELLEQLEKRLRVENWREAPDDERPQLEREGTEHGRCVLGAEGVNSRLDADS